MTFSLLENIHILGTVHYSEFFRKQLVPAKLKKNEFCATPVETQNILPYIAKDKEEVRTMSIQILLNSHEYQQLLSKLFPTTKGQVSMAQQSELGVLQSSNETISVPVNAVLTDLPEIAQTKALCAAYFSKDFIINQIDATRGQQNLCKYSTSRPDICFYHNANFFFDTKLVAAVTPTIPSDEIEESGSNFEPYTDSHVQSGTLYRASGKDKTHNASKGQGQLVAAMMLTATTIGKVAISKEKFFTKAVIFGFTRQTSDNTCNF